jgi:hypothetical protein
MTSTAVRVRWEPGSGIRVLERAASRSDVLVDRPSVTLGSAWSQAARATLGGTVVVVVASHPVSIPGR